METRTISNGTRENSPAEKKDQNKNYSRATAPTKFSWEDWKQIGQRIKIAYTKDHIGIISAGIAFFAMLSIFPLLLAIVSIYGLFADPTVVEEQIQAMSQAIPDEAAVIIGTQIQDIVANSPATLGFGAAISIIFAIGSAAKGMKAVMEGFNIAYNEEETRGIIKLQLQAMLLTLGAVLTIITAIVLIAILPAVLNFVGLTAYTENLLLVGRWPLLALVFILGLSVIHRFAADRKEPKWRWVTVGSVVSTILILLASAGFAFFAEKFGDFNQTYGSIAGAIVLLLWLYLMSLALLLGAELNSEIEHQTIIDSTKGKDKPMEQREATVADTLPSESH